VVRLKGGSKRENQLLGGERPKWGPLGEGTAGLSRGKRHLTDVFSFSEESVRNSTQGVGCSCSWGRPAEGMGRTGENEKPFERSSDFEDAKIIEERIGRKSFRFPRKVVEKKGI